MIERRERNHYRSIPTPALDRSRKTPAGKLLAASLLLIASIAGFLFCPASARAQQSIDVDDISLGEVGEEEFFAGYALFPSHAIFWESDIPWRITLRSLDPDLGMSDDGTYIKSLGDLLWKLSDEESWLPVTQDDEEIDWSSETGDGAVYIDTVVLLDWVDDRPGHYEAELIFTIESL